MARHGTDVALVPFCEANLSEPCSVLEARARGEIMIHLRIARLCLLALLVAGFVTIPAPSRADVGISFDFFYSDLSPHGSWLVSGSYGRVWQPAVYRAGWNPYYDGHWVYTDVGWAWLSDYEWGAVPYHYGTWVLDMDLGWVWV